MVSRDTRVDEEETLTEPVPPTLGAFLAAQWKQMVNPIDG